MNDTAQSECPPAQDELSTLRAECERLNDVQRQIMLLLKVDSPDRILHDFRNVLNELALLRALNDLQP